MTTLFVANTTQQDHLFVYRVPEESGTRTQRIVAGTQARIYNDTDMRILAHIAQQHAQYGLIPVEEVPRHRKFIGMCFSFDKPIDLERLQLAYEHNEGVLEKMGEENRAEVAAAVANDLTTVAGQEVGHIEVEIVEETKPGVTPKVASGYEIVSPSSPARRRALPVSERGN